jgi:hypothetical protein
MSINIINKKIFFVILIIFSFFKFFFAFVYGDHFYEMEWSIIVKNLIEDFSFSFHEIDKQKIPTFQRVLKQHHLLARLILLWIIPYFFYLFLNI